MQASLKAKKKGKLEKQIRLLQSLAQIGLIKYRE
jgi:hypothetical protein